MVPLFTVIIFNVIVFILVARVIIKQAKRSISRAKEKKKNLNVTVKTLITIVSVMLMFGFSWLFGALSIADAALVFQFLFVIFATSQGFCLFVFFCVIGKDAREEWKRLLTCYRYDGEKKRSAMHSHSVSSAGTRKTTKETSFTSNMATIRKAAKIPPPKRESPDLLKSFNEMEMGKISPIETDFINSIIEEEGSIINSNDLTSFVGVEEKQQDSQLPPQVLFRLKRPFYDLVEQNRAAQSSPDFTSTQPTQSEMIFTDTEMTQSEMYTNTQFTESEMFNTQLSESVILDADLTPTEVFYNTQLSDFSDQVSLNYDTDVDDYQLTKI